jgi:hypothetical protein
MISASDDGSTAVLVLGLRLGRLAGRWLSDDSLALVAGRLSAGALLFIRADRPNPVGWLVPRANAAAASPASP